MSVCVCVCININIHNTYMVLQHSWYVSCGVFEWISWRNIYVYNHNNKCKKYCCRLFEFELYVWARHWQMELKKMKTTIFCLHFILFFLSLVLSILLFRLFLIVLLFDQWDVILHFTYILYIYIKKAVS